MKVLILKPRLDVAFKRGIIPSTRGAIAPIRIHWHNIHKVLCARHSANDMVKTVELPLWQFSPELVNELKPDLVYVPHKEMHNFPVPNCNVLYYMQMVFPWMFSIDPLGWCAGSSMYPNRYPKTRERHFANLKAYVKTHSKFDQPSNRYELPIKDYVFFPLQIPHDQTILYHSRISVEEALELTCKACETLNLPLVIKPHPVNPSSMVTLKAIASKYKIHWIDDLPIQSLLEGCRVVVTVNSGVGVEALLHSKPVIVFGRSDYDCVANKANANNLHDLLLNPMYNEAAVENHIDRWVSWLQKATEEGGHER